MDNFSKEMHKFSKDLQQQSDKCGDQIQQNDKNKYNLTRLQTWKGWNSSKSGKTVMPNGRRDWFTVYTTDYSIKFNAKYSFVLDCTVNKKQKKKMIRKRKQNENGKRVLRLVIHWPALILILFILWFQCSQTKIPFKVPACKNIPKSKMSSNKVKD